MRKATPQRELRYLGAKELRATTGEDGKRKVGGYAAVYNSRSVDLGGFVEIIAPGAFQSALTADADVLCLRDHDASLLMGRTKSGTLKLSSDDTGLAFECELPNTDSASALYESVQRGDLDACSFGFITKADSWDQVGSEVVRTLIDVELLEVSVVSFPAYPETSAAIRTAPAEIRSFIEKRDGVCTCACAQCVSGACNICSDPDCSADGCTCPDDVIDPADTDDTENNSRRSNDMALAAILAARLR